VKLLFEITINFIDTRALDRVLFKLKKVKKALKGWGFNLTGFRKKRKQIIQEILMDLEEAEESGSRSADQLRVRMVLTTELYQIMEEELVWLQRSHETWLLKGDNNSEYFHQIANGKKRKQTIFHL
jgi:hypothetical protein